MNDVSVVARLPAQPVDSGAEGDLDELQEKLVPVEEEQLPQGVADLLATLIWRQRHLTGVGRPELRQALGADQGVGERQVQPAAPQPVALAVARNDRQVLSMPKSEVNLPLPLPTERSVTLIEPLSHDQSPPSKERAVLDQAPPSKERVALDQTLPSIERAALDYPVESPQKALHNAHRQSNTPSGLLPVSTPILAVPPAPLLEISEASEPRREFLQVPFNKGNTHGQVTISRLPGEPMQNLVLSPSNSQVLEHLREPFEQVRDTHWRLSENPDEHPHQGSRQSPEDEQEEHQEPGA